MNGDVRGLVRRWWLPVLLAMVLLLAACGDSTPVADQDESGAGNAGEEVDITSGDDA